MWIQDLKFVLFGHEMKMLPYIELIVHPFDLVYARQKNQHGPALRRQVRQVDSRSVAFDFPLFVEHGDQIGGHLVALAIDGRVRQILF